MKRVEKSPYAARPSMTMPIQRPKNVNIAKGKARRMPVKTVSPKREGNSHGVGEKQNGRDQQETQVLSGRESTGTKTSEGDVGHASQRTEMCSAENQANTEPSRCVSETNSEDNKKHNLTL